MGHMAAVFVLIKINVTAVRTALANSSRFAHCAILNDRSPRCEGVNLATQCAVYIHVDDFGCMGADEETADALASEISVVLKYVGFSLTFQLAGVYKRYIGLEASTQPAR
jgi:hypothetical protein